MHQDRTMGETPSTPEIWWRTCAFKISTGIFEDNQTLAQWSVTSNSTGDGHGESSAVSSPDNVKSTREGLLDRCVDAGFGVPRKAGKTSFGIHALLFCSWNLIPARCLRFLEPFLFSLFLFFLGFLHCTAGLETEVIGSAAFMIRKLREQDDNESLIEYCPNEWIVIINKIAKVCQLWCKVLTCCSVESWQNNWMLAYAPRFTRALHHDTPVGRRRKMGECNALKETVYQTLTSGNRRP